MSKSQLTDESMIHLVKQSKSSNESFLILFEKWKENIDHNEINQ